MKLLIKSFWVFIFIFSGYASAQIAYDKLTEPLKPLISEKENLEIKIGRAHV